MLFSGRRDARAGSAGVVALLLGVYLGWYGSFIVRDDNFMESLNELGKDCRECRDQFEDICNVLCKPYHAFVMLLCAVIFGSIGCFTAIVALATTFTVASPIVGV